MANATPREVLKTRLVEETYTETDGVVLELTDEEAALISAILGGHVCGGGHYRYVSTEIWRTLGGAGYFRDENKLVRDINMHTTGMVDIDG